VAWDDAPDCDGDQVVPIADSALLSAKLVKNATLKVYKGYSHGMALTHADLTNADLLAFIRSWSRPAHEGWLMRQRVEEARDPLPTSSAERSHAPDPSSAGLIDLQASIFLAPPTQCLLRNPDLTARLNRRRTSTHQHIHLAMIGSAVNRWRPIAFSKSHAPKRSSQNWTGFSKADHIH
jgi:hypothetical protein